MFELAISAVGLGLAGIDPAGLLIALGALAAGARERTVIAFGVVVLLGTALLGTVLSLTVGQQLQSFDWTSLLPPDWVGAVVELALAAGLWVWTVVRLRRPEARPPRPARVRRTGAALLWAGLGFAATAPLDPTFLGLVVLGGRDASVAAVAFAHLVWVVVSQVTLVALVVAILLGRHGRAVAWLQDLMPRARPVLAKVGTAALAIAALVMTVDAVWWFAAGEFLLPDPT